eukprot:4541183-Pyramimonas_sp.AAC.1
MRPSPLTSQTAAVEGGGRERNVSEHCATCAGPACKEHRNHNAALRHPASRMHRNPKKRTRSKTALGSRVKA